MGTPIVTPSCFLHDDAVDPLLIHSSSPGFLMGDATCSGGNCYDQGGLRLD